MENYGISGGGLFTHSTKYTCFDPEENPKVVLRKSREDLQWNHCTSTPRWFETNEIAERAVRTVKDGHSSILLQSGLDEKWEAESMECYC